MGRRIGLWFKLHWNDLLFWICALALILSISTQTRYNHQLEKENAILVEQVKSLENENDRLQMVGDDYYKLFYFCQTGENAE